MREMRDARDARARFESCEMRGRDSGAGAGCERRGLDSGLGFGLFAGRHDNAVPPSRENALLRWG
jgi:hypothetical protein